MRLQKVGAVLAGAVLVFALSGCNLFAPQVTDDNPGSTQTTGKEETKSDDSKTKSEDYATKLAGTYELDNEDFTEKDGKVTHVSNEDYQATVDQTGLRFTLDLKSDGTGILTSPVITNKRQSTVSFTWKTDDGKSITFSGFTADDKMVGQIDGDGNITLELSQGGEKGTLVFKKISDKPGYYGGSSK